MSVFYFFLTHTATSEIYTLSLHDALPICLPVDDVGAHAARVVEEPHRVRRARHRGHALRGDEASHEPLRALVAHQEVPVRSEEHTSELQSHVNLVCRLLLEKKKSRK